MDAPGLGRPATFWASPEYSVKVRGERYLWGSAGLAQNLKFAKPLILHITNDLAGAPVTIGTRLAAGTKTDLGTIEPGECLSVSVSDIAGIYASCALDSLVHCLIC